MILFCNCSNIAHTRRKGKYMQNLNSLSQVKIFNTHTGQVFVYTWQTPMVFVLVIGGIPILAVIGYYLINFPLSLLKFLATLIVFVYCYFVSAFTLNKTIIQVTDFTLSVNHIPVPWSGNWVIPIQDITSVYCERLGYRKTLTYNLRIILRNGKGLTLLSLKDLELAESFATELSRCIKSRIGIANIH